MLELIPLGVLFGNPERESPRISPDGTKLAWIAPSGEVLNVWLAQISAEAGVDAATGATEVLTEDWQDTLYERLVVSLIWLTADLTGRRTDRSPMLAHKRRDRETPLKRAERPVLVLA